MASLDFAKYTNSSMGGLSVHFEQEKRERLQHSNKDINRELSHTNYCIGTSSYEESVNRCRERTEQVDREIPPKRVKKDRVIMDMCYIPCPNEIENRDDFFQRSYDFLVDRFGVENVHGAFIHKDEVHEYRDSRVRDENDHQAIKTSMEHMHVMISPYTEERGINSKAFNTREMFQSIQQDFNDYVYQEFGIEYNTREQALGLEVEALKEATTLLDLKEMERAALEVELIETQEKVDQQQELINSLELTIQQQEKELQAVKEDIQDKLKEHRHLSNRDRVESKVSMPYGIETKEIGLFNKEQYVKYSDVSKVIEQAQRQTNLANDIIRANENNIYREKHYQYVAEELADTVKHYRHDDLIVENDRLNKRVNELSTSLEREQNNNRTLSDENQNLKEQNNALFDVLNHVAQLTHQHEWVRNILSRNETMRELYEGIDQQIEIQLSWDEMER